MNTTEWIMLVQTIVLALTGFIVYWYTKETQKIRKETSNQNVLLSEQLKLMKDQMLSDEKRARSLLDPFFVYNGGGSSADGIDIKMINKGSLIRNIKIKNLEIPHSFSPRILLESDKMLNFHFPRLSPDLAEEIEFELEFEDKFGDKREKRMILNTKKRQIVER